MTKTDFSNERILLWLLLIIDIMLALKYRENNAIAIFGFVSSVFALVMLYIIQKKEKEIEFQKLIDIGEKTKGQWDL